MSSENELDENVQRRPDVEEEDVRPEPRTEAPTGHDSMTARVHIWTAVTRRVMRR